MTREAGGRGGREIEDRVEVFPCLRLDARRVKAKSLREELLGVNEEFLCLQEICAL